MASDRFVYFDKGKRPSKEDVKKALVDYLGATMTNIKWRSGRWTAQLVGSKSWPFRRLEPDSRLAPAYEEEAKEDRWIEVFFHRNSIDVLTRRQDELTNNIARGFAQLLARYWQGRLEIESEDDQVVEVVLAAKRLAEAGCECPCCIGEGQCDNQKALTEALNKLVVRE